MRLIGFSFSGAPPPLRRGYVPFGSISGIVGANDTGKSSLLNLITRALSGQESETSFMFFAGCTPGEFDALTRRALSDRTAPLEESSTSAARSISRWRNDFFGHVSGDAVDRITLSASDDPVVSWAKALKESASGHPDAWSQVIDAITRRASVGPDGEHLGDTESVIGIEPVEDRSVSEWNLFWCLPPVDQLDDPTRAALKRIGRHQSVNDPELWTPWPEAEKAPPHLEADLPDGWWVAGDADPQHRRMACGPLVIAPIGRTDLQLLPSPIPLPIDQGEGREILTEGLEDAARRLEWAADTAAVVREESAYDGGDLFELRSADDAWLYLEGEAATLSGYSTGVVTALARTANAILPKWLAAEYRIGIQMAPPHRIPLDGRIQLVAKRKGVGEHIPLDRLAAGHQLWIQLALMEALERLRHDLALLIHAAELAQEQYNESIELGGEGPSESLLDECDAYAQSLFDGEELGSTNTPGERSLDWLLSRPERSLSAYAAIVRGRLYVLDEPERHLHPRVQRLAAEWLQDSLRVQGSQALIATHSPAFISLADAAYTYVVRVSPRPSELRPINPREWTRLSQEATELGLDRGELLTMVRVFLWVEGRHDVAVLEALFQTELREFGIAVVSVEGYGRSSGVLDAEALLRFTEARAAVWLDKVPEAVVLELNGDPSAAERIRASREGYSDEARHAARLLLAARAEDKPIELLPNPANDVLELLDERAVKALFPLYPGHAEALDEAQAAGYTSGGAHKEFLAQKYGLPVTASALRDIANHMVEKGVSPSPHLRGVIERCERLAMELA